MPASPDDMAATMIANMKSKTGKTLEQWLAIAKKTGAEKHGQIVKFLTKLVNTIERSLALGWRPCRPVRNPPTF